MSVERNNAEPRRLPKPPGKGASRAEVRAYFQKYKPTLEELIATGDYGPPMTLGEVLRRQVERHTREHKHGGE